MAELIEMPQVKIYPDLGPLCSYPRAIRSDTAIQNGLLDNTPTQQQYDNMVLVYHQVIIPIFNHFGVAPAINSFFRSSVLQKKIKGRWQSVNSIVGGSPTSDHPNGRAVDLSYRFVNTPITNIDLARFVRDQLDFDQLIVEKIDPISLRPAWVHVGYRTPATNRKQVLEAKFKGLVPNYIPI